MSKEIGDRLKLARKHAKFHNAVEAADALGMPYPTYAGHENGNRGVARAAEKYARRYRVSLDWLLRGKGAGPGETDDLPSDDVIVVPKLSWVSAGELQREDIADEALGSVVVSGLPAGGEWLALAVVGDSMDRISPPESVIFVDRKDKQLIPNGLYVIDDGEGNASYKRYRPGPPMRFEPVSTNAGIDPIFPENEPTIIGRVRRSMIDM